MSRKGRSPRENFVLGEERLDLLAELAQKSGLSKAELVRGSIDFTLRDEYPAWLEYVRGFNNE